MKKTSIILGVIIVLIMLLACPNPTGTDDVNNAAADNNVDDTGSTSTIVTFQDAAQIGGTSGKVDSTALILTFDVDPGSLTAYDITVTGATKNIISGSGRTRTLTISEITVGNGETVSVSIANYIGYTINGSPKTAIVYRGLHIGMPFRGGIIAYFLQFDDPGYVSGEIHGLIASTADLSSGLIWGIRTTIGEIKTAMGTGQANTTAIVNKMDTNRNYAALLCDDYTNADTGTGVYSDWFLPSKDELYKLYQNRTAIGGFSSSSYWSSSEESSDYAWRQIFSNGTQTSYDKFTNHRVRAVRAF